MKDNKIRSLTLLCLVALVTAGCVSTKLKRIKAPYEAGRNAISKVPIKKFCNPGDRILVINIGEPQIKLLKRQVIFKEEMQYLENGIYKAISDNKVFGLEKVRELKFKDKADYKGQVSQLNPLLLKDWTKIREKYAADRIMLYKIIDFKKTSEFSATAFPFCYMSPYRCRTLIYCRFIDPNANGKILWSGIVRGDTKEITKEEKLPPELKHYDTARNVALRIPQKVLSEMHGCLLVNVGESFGATVKETEVTTLHTTIPPEVQIEDGLVSGITEKNRDALLEKLAYLPTKQPWQYEILAFYLNPLLYDNWDEMRSKTNCSQILFYRLIDGPKEIYMKLVDVENKGGIIWSGVVAAKEPEEFRTLVNLIKKSKIKKSMDSYDMVLVINEDSLMFASPRKELYTAENMLLEEAIVTGLYESGITVVEKISNIYLESLKSEKFDSPEMLYDPFILRRWAALSDQNIGNIILYDITKGTGKKVVIHLKLVDTRNGELKLTELLSVKLTAEGE